MILPSLEKRLWLANVLNIVALAWQVTTMWNVRSGAGVSPMAFLMIFYIQVTFAELGWRVKNKATFWGMIVCAVLSLAIIFSAVYFQRFS